jgi:hypothetical protein
MGTGKRRRRRYVEPTDELRWEQLELLCSWDEQVEYERIRPLLGFCVLVAAAPLFFVPDAGTSGW